MTTTQQLKQCAWLISTIQRARRITFEEISQKWRETEMSAGMELSRTTFNRMRDAVQTMFGVIIECERKGGYHYYIYNQQELACPIKEIEGCEHCLCNKMEGTLLICQPKHCILAKIDRE